jgi:hypothetical protein
MLIMNEGTVLQRTGMKFLFWVTVLCTLVERCRCFGEMYCLHLHIIIIIIIIIITYLSQIWTQYIATKHYSLRW